MAAETVNFVNRRIASGGRFVTKQAERSLSHRNLISGKAWAAAAICLAVFLFSLFFIPIRNDDPYITARYARNLAAGNGFVYNSGERVLGTTSPLLTLILAAAMIPLPAEFALRLVTAALFAICSAAFWIYGSRFGQPLAGIAAALIFPAVDWSFLLAGNETPLFTALLLFALVTVDSGRLKVAGLAAGLLPLARGEGLLLAPLLGLLAARRHGWKKTLPFAATFLCAAVPWFCFSRFYFGEWLPQTLAMKRLQVEKGTHFSYNPAPFFRASWLGLHSVYGPLAWLGLLRAFRPAGWRLAVWGIIHTLAYVLLRVADYPWYHYPLVAGTVWSAACGVELAALGLVKLSRRALQAPSHSSPTLEFPLALSMAVILAAISIVRNRADPPFGPPLGSDLKSRYERYREIGQWLRTNAAPGESVLLGEIGIIGFYAWPMRVIDQWSLIHRGIPRGRIGNFNALALERNPEWVVAYHWQGPYFSATDGSRLRVYEQKLALPVPEVSSEPKLGAVYRILPQPPPDWDTGFYPPENWNGVEVRWTHRSADIRIPETSGKFKIRYWASHPGLKRLPITVTLRTGDEILASADIAEKGVYEFEVDAARIKSGVCL